MKMGQEVIFRFTRKGKKHSGYLVHEGNDHFVVIPVKNKKVRGVLKTHEIYKLELGSPWTIQYKTDLVFLGDEE
jgi:hypothetical protein